MAQNIEIITPRQDYQFVETFFDLSSGSHFWFKWRFNAFLQQLKDAKFPLETDLRTLDVGAGAGVLREQIESASRWNVDITDVDHQGLAAAKDGRGRTYYYDILEKRADWAEKYDAVTLFDVLEHIEDTRPFLDAILFHLKPNGSLFINVPAMPVLFSRYDEVQGHFRRYTMPSLEKEFDGLPIEIIDKRFWGWINIPVLLMRRFWLHYFSSNKSNEQIFKEGFAPPGDLINQAFLALMRLELALPTPRSVGSSILMAVRKRR